MKDFGDHFVDKMEMSLGTCSNFNVRGAEDEILCSSYLKYNILQRK